MLFNSFEFLLFFPFVSIVYFSIPHKIRYLWLLGASYFFYMNWNAKYALLLFGSTFITYVAGIVIGRFQKKEIDEVKKVKYKKICVAISFILNLSILAIFKYANFAINNLNMLLEKLHLQMDIPNWDIVLPVGISFYIFQALSYTVDVYRGEIEPQKNLAKYALFVSFFPQLVAGPIERSKNLLHQLDEVHKFDYRRMTSGILLMIWGYFLKLVISDRIALLVDNVYGNYSTYGGYYLLVASLLFAFQIYCDFAGYSTIAMGVAEVMGFHLMDNFNCPYFSRSVSEFWRRWHISLSSWFKDYLYIPLGGNRRGKIRKYLNLLVVFAVSGLWHGAEWTFVIWGTLNGLYQIVGGELVKIRDKVVKVFKFNRETLSHKIYQTVCTFVLIDFSWIFFRADSISDAFAIFKSMLQGGNLNIIFDGTIFSAGLDQNNFIVLIISLGVLCIVDALKYKGIVVRDVLMKQELWFRWMVYIVAVMSILIFGVWGTSYDATSFIYFQF